MKLFLSFAMAVAASGDEIDQETLATQIDEEIELRKSWTELVHTEGAVQKCCYSKSSPCGDSCTEDWCSSSHWHCAYCSRGNAITAASVDGLADLLSCGGLEDVVLDAGSSESSEGPSVGPTIYETNLDTLIDTGGVSNFKPDESEWPAGHSPQCCWGGCEGSCEHTNSWCSQDADTCGDCNSHEGGMWPEFHMCPDGTQDGTQLTVDDEGPTIYETNLDTLIDTGGVSNFKPDESEWPAGHSPQCCWGGCEGSCEHTHSWCSQDADTCGDCNSHEGGLVPEFHMCPGGTQLTVDDEGTIFIPDGKEFRCCWKAMAHHDTASCDNCDTSWCSESIDKCNQCAGEVMICAGGEVTQTLAPGAVIPVGDEVEHGKQWQCCWDAQCGQQTCNEPDSWCSASTSQCSDCAGSMTLCDIPPPPTLAPGEFTDSELAALLPAGSEWTCCPDSPCDTNCYSELNWCGVSNTNCRQCNAVMHACPVDRRLVHENALSMAVTSAGVLPVLALGALSFGSIFM